MTLASLVKPDQQGQPDLLVLKERLALPEKLVLPDPPDHLALRVPQDLLDQPGQQDLWVKPVLLVRQDQPGQQVQVELRE